MSMNYVPTRIVMGAVWWYCESADTWVHDFNQEPPVTQRDAGVRLNSHHTKLTVHDSGAGWLGYHARLRGVGAAKSLEGAISDEMSAWFRHGETTSPTVTPATPTPRRFPLLVVVPLVLVLAAVVVSMVLA